jgi:hypothetical protein
MDTTIRVGRVTMQRHHYVLSGKREIGTVLVTTHIAEGNEETTYSAHVHAPTHRMLPITSATLSACVDAVVAYAAAYESFVTARDVAVQP